MIKTVQSIQLKSQKETYNRPVEAICRVYQIRALISGLAELSDNLGLHTKDRHVIYYNEPKGSKQKDVIHDLTHDNTRPFTIKPWELFEEEEKELEDKNVGKFSELLSANQ